MIRLTICLLCTLAFLPGSLSAGEKALPPDLAFVPPNCAGFIHFRMQDIWKSEHLKEWRETLLKAGDDTLSTLNMKFFPSLSSVERVTIMFTASDQRFGFGTPEPTFIIACSKAIDRKAFLKTAASAAKEVKQKKRGLHLL